MRLRLLLLLALLAFTPKLSAQMTLLAGGTNNVAAATTNTYNAKIESFSGQYVGLQISFSCLGTNDKSILFKVFPMIDGATPATWNSNYLFSVPAAGTNPVVYSTNLAFIGSRYFQLQSITNPNTNTATGPLTNLSVIYITQ